LNKGGDADFSKAGASGVLDRRSSRLRP